MDIQTVLAQLAIDIARKSNTIDRLEMEIEQLNEQLKEQLKEFVNGTVPSD